MKSAPPSLPSPFPKLRRAEHRPILRQGHLAGDWVTTERNCAKDLERMLALGAGQPGSSKEPCVRPAHAARNGARPALLERRC